MYQIKLAILLLLLLMLPGCSSNLATPDNQPVPKETQILAPPTPTLISTALSMETAGVAISQAVIDLTSIAFENVAVDGFLVIENSDGNSRSYFLYDMKNKETIDIGENRGKINIFSVSPNNTFMLAGICPTDKCNYFLRTAAKIIRPNLSTGDDWVLARWLDNERVVFLRRSQPRNEVIYNAFTSETSSLRLDIPNPYMLNGTGLIAASLDPSLKRAVFNDRDHRLVLWNLETQKEIASLPLADTTDQLGSVGWSPDGKKFVSTSPNKQETSVNGPVPTANELFMFDMSGTLTQLTYYNQNYKFANVTNPIWSPDSRYIAFWLRTSDDRDKADKLQQWLAIFDMSTLKTTLYRSTFDDLTPTIWSPNGEQLIVRMNGRFILVDLAHETQSQIPDIQETWIENWMMP